MTNSAHQSSDAIAILRGCVLIILLLGLLGTGAELLLLEHIEGYWQKVPLVLITLSLATLALQAAIRRVASVRIFQATMLLVMASGVAGLVLHYRGNVEFELEMHPTNAGWPLFWQALKGATPALAPGMMIQLGLLGLAWTFRHPLLAAANSRTTTH